MLETVPVAHGAIESPINVNNTCPLAISSGPGVYCVITFRFDVVNDPSPPLLIQCKLVTLLEVAPEVKITEFSQIANDGPAKTLGFFCTGITTVLEYGVPQGVFGWAVMVNTIWLLEISRALGVTKGFKIVVFEMLVPVVEVQT